MVTGFVNDAVSVDDAPTSRTNLGLGSIATEDSNNVTITGGSITGITDLLVADGGTGRSDATAYAVICGGTTSTNPHQSIASVGTSGQVLTSNGAGALPTFQDNGNGDVVGPGSATSGNLASYGDVSGKLIADSGVASGDVVTSSSNITQYQVVVADTGSKDVAALGSVGTSGQVLTSNGAGSNPSWQDATGGGGLTWNSVAGTSQSIAVNNGYIPTNGSQTSFALPSTAAVGDTFAIAGYGSGLWDISQGAGQTIHFNGTDTTTGAGGSVTATNRYNSMELICVVTDTDFVVRNSSGTFTLV